MEELKNALLSIPLDNLLYAFCASFTGYVALSTYDYLALKYIQRKLAAWKWILTGFVGFSISNNASELACLAIHGDINITALLRIYVNRDYLR